MYNRGELVFKGACANLAASVLYCLFIIMYCRTELISEGACANLAASVLYCLLLCTAGGNWFLKERVLIWQLVYWQVYRPVWPVIL